MPRIILDPAEVFSLAHAEACLTPPSDDPADETAILVEVVRRLDGVCEVIDGLDRRIELQRLTIARLIEIIGS